LEALIVTTAPLRKPTQLLKMEEPMVSQDGESLWLKIVTEERTLDVAVPFSRLGDAVQFLVSCASFVLDYSNDPPTTGMQTGEWAPIPIRGIGLGAGRDPNETILMIQLACCQLAFPVPGSDLARLADDFSRKARTLSAGHGKPN
jgi:hypothetical protein